MVDYPSLGMALAALLGAGAAYITAKSAKKSSAEQTQISVRKVELDAFELAQGLLESAVAQLRVELTEAKVQLVSAREALDKELSNRQFLEQRVSELELTVHRLRSRLKAAGVEEFDPATNIDRNPDSKEDQ